RLARVAQPAGRDRAGPAAGAAPDPGQRLRPGPAARSAESDAHPLKIAYCILQIADLAGSPIYNLQSRIYNHDSPVSAASVSGGNWPCKIWPPSFCNAATTV